MTANAASNWRQVRRAGVEPAQRKRGRVTAAWALQCPADAAASSVGFEPTISALRERRALRAAPRGQVARVGVEPTAFLDLIQNGLPVAYRAGSFRGEGIEPSQAASKTAGLPLADPREWLAAIASCGGRIRTCNRLLNREPPYRLGYTAMSAEHPAGVEPARPAWETGRLPLHHGRFGARRNRSGAQWDQRGLEPYCNNAYTGRSSSGSLHLGPGRLEPPPFGLKGRHTAPNTSVPTHGLDAGKGKKFTKKGGVA